MRSQGAHTALAAYGQIFNAKQLVFVSRSILLCMQMFRTWLWLCKLLKSKILKALNQARSACMVPNHKEQKIWEIYVFVRILKICKLCSAY